MTGQDAVNAASAFNEALGIDGVIPQSWTATPAAARRFQCARLPAKPIKFAGMGESLIDFEVFHPERMASRILGMGDVLSLIEKAERQIDLKQAEELARKMQGEQV